jgi:beta propeller repeat protein
VIRILFVFFAIILALGWLMVAAPPQPAMADGPTVTEFPICTVPAGQAVPDISAEIVVWYDERNGNSDIYGYDLSSGTEFPICTHPADQTGPAISGEIVVWADERNGNSDIYGYDLSSGTEFPICTNTADQAVPDISGEIVVWVDDAYSPCPDIYGYDLSSGTEFAICTHPAGQFNLAISGEIVVWQDDRNGNFDIYGYDLSAHTEFPICTHPAEQWFPAISGDIVVWRDDRNGNFDIYGYDLSSGTEFAICTRTDWQTEPAISGDIVVWTDFRNGNWDMYGYDLSSGTEFAICTHPATQGWPAISGDIVVWADLRNGNWDIYGARLSFVPPPLPAAAFFDWLTTEHPEVNCVGIAYYDTSEGMAILEAVQACCDYYGLELYAVGVPVGTIDWYPPATWMVVHDPDLAIGPTIELFNAMRDMGYIGLCACSYWTEAGVMLDIACAGPPSPPPEADSYEPDDTYAQASTITVDGASQSHNFHVAGDNDWVKFSATLGTIYVIETFNLGSNCDTYMYLYDTDGTTLITYDDDSGEGLASRITWTAPADGTYYICIRHYNSNTYGPDTNYDLKVTTTPPPPPGYCSCGGTIYGEEWISRVQFNTIDKSSSGDGYADYTSISTDVARGSTYALEVTISQIDSWPEYVKAYFDWNQDLDFEDSGEGIEIGYCSSSGCVVSTNIDIPGDATLGSTRMRIVQQYDSYHGPCGSYTYGDTEDYAVNIVLPAGCTLIDWLSREHPEVKCVGIAYYDTTEGMAIRDAVQACCHYYGLELCAYVVPPGNIEWYPAATWIMAHDPGLAIGPTIELLDAMRDMGYPGLYACSYWTEAGLLLDTECAGPPPPRPVGGSIIPTDKLGLVMPWIVAAALILAAGVSLAVWKRKRGAKRASD